MNDLPAKVILSEHLDEEAADWLAERVQLVRCSPDDPAQWQAELQEAEGLVVRTYTRVDTALLAAAPKLRVVARAGVGLDNIDLKACAERKVRVVHTPDANTQAVVEYVWALIFDHLRPRVSMDRYTPPPMFHRMRHQHVGRQCDRMQLGILGMGRIGRRVAEVAHAFGMRVGYHDLKTRRQLALPDEEPSEYLDRNTLLTESDILSIHVDGRIENHGLIDEAALGKLKKSCLLINTSRGFVVAPEAL
ncbi:MAG: NAD(P)-dependent oxidoreductase, partial [Phycisphaeraceae bacterium]|nr:NAD(P)-dependent oxidoreductase [Phycisphaeraceae bacterium]